MIAQAHLYNRPPPPVEITESIQMLLHLSTSTLFVSLHKLSISGSLYLYIYETGTWLKWNKWTAYACLLLPCKYTLPTTL